MAFNADDVTKELWRSQGKDAAASDTRDSFGLLARFTPPVVANGKVFVGTAGDAEPLRRYGPAARAGSGQLLPDGVWTTLDRFSQRGHGCAGRVLDCRPASWLLQRHLHVAGLFH